MSRKPFDLEAAKVWIKSAEGKPPVIASRQTTARHDSEWQSLVSILPKKTSS